MRDFRELPLRPDEAGHERVVEPSRLGHMLFYGVISSQTEAAVDLFVERQEAEAFIGEVAEDEPETASQLRVEAINFGSP